MKELVAIKGSCNGLKLIIDPSINSFSDLKPKILEKLKYTPNFFTKDTKIILDKCTFSPKDLMELHKLLKEYNLELSVKSMVFRGSNKDLKAKKQDDKIQEDLILYRHIRSGEELYHNGNIIIYGNVNPGAKVISSLNIIVHGSCKGFVWAGKPHNKDAFIMAEHLVPSQVKIASTIAIKPNNFPLEDNKVSMKAFIENSLIVFEQCDIIKN